MDPRAVYLQKHQVPELIDHLVSHLVEAQPANPRQWLANQLVAMGATKYAASACAPPTEGFHSTAPHVIPADVYGRLRNSQTASGHTLDECLVDGLDHATAGQPVPAGAVALPGLSPTDADCFVSLADAFEAVVQARHGIAYQARAAPLYLQDFTVSKVRGGFNFDERRVKSIVCRLRRNVSGFAFAPAASRPERRALENLIAGACRGFSGSNNGRVYPVADMPSELPQKPRNAPLLLPAFHTSPLRSCYREWPDARSVFIADDNAAAVHVNCGSEHIEVVTVAGHGGNMREAFDRASEWMAVIESGLREAGHEFASHPRLGALTADLDYLGSGVSVEATVDLPHLARHPRFAAALQKQHYRLGVDWALAGVELPHMDRSNTHASLAKLPSAVGSAHSEALQPLLDDGAATSTEVTSHAAGGRTPQMESDESPGGVRVSTTGSGPRSPFRVVTAESLSVTPVEQLQHAIDGLARLVELEGLLEKGGAHATNVDVAM